ncbi:MAG: hypothetical protein WC244_00805 [Patescibacteria group bacterium]|jgi:hypothetical protein
MDNRKRIIITLLVVAVIVLLAFIIWLIFGTKNVNQPINSQNNNNSQTVSTGNGSAVLPVSSPVRVAEEKKYPLGLKQLALSFSERYGSYSTDQKFKNLDDLKPFMSDKMQKTINDAIAMERASTSSVDTFQGITTRGLSADLISSEVSSAIIVVQAQRTISTGNGLEPVISYKNLKLSFIKVGNEWKVDDAIWQ